MAAQHMETLDFCRQARARGEWIVAVTVLDAAIAQMATGNAAQLAELLLERADLALAQGDVGTAEDGARRAGPLADRAGKGHIAAQAAWLLGAIWQRQQDPARARYWWGQAAEMALVAEAWPIALRCQQGLAALDRAASEPDKAKSRLEGLVDDARELGLFAEEMGVRLDLAQLAVDSRDVDTAVAQLQIILADPERLGVLHRGEAGLLRARLLVAVDDVAGAVEAVDQAIPWLRMAGHVRSLGAGLLLQGQLWLVAGKAEAAGALLGEALQLTRDARLPEAAVVESVIARILAHGPQTG